MLDHFTIFTRSGTVLWQRSFAPVGLAQAASATSVIDALVRHAFIEERAAEQRWEKDGYALRWTLANDLELVFVAVHQRILQLSYITDLLAQVKAQFLSHFTPFLKALHAHARGTGSLSAEQRASFAAALEAWDAQFTRTLRELERGAAVAARRKPAALAESTSSLDTPGDSGTDTPTAPANADGAPTDVSKNVEALKARLKAAGVAKRGGRSTSGAARKGSSKGTETPGSGAESPSTPGKKKAPAKEMRRWEGGKVTDRHVEALDFSGSSAAASQGGAGAAGEEGTLAGWIDEKSMGKEQEDGTYQVADVGADASDDEEDEAQSKGFLSRFGALSSAAAPGSNSFFSRLTGSHALTEADVAPALAAMQAHLQSKNVAADVAQRLCASVARSLVGRQLGSFGSVKAEVRKALEEAITRILTPRSSTDILVEIGQKRQRGLAARAAASGAKAEEPLEPYSMAFVGVNGVGKSTSLAKVCFWLLQNRLRVLIAACDTFRSGAVEQLRVHVRNLGQLEVGGERVADGTSDGKAKLELYERGYGKDAAGIAKEALTYARREGFDVVVIDSAGRQQGNEPLMRALAKLVSINSPDKVIFVGEAIVGNEAQAQVVGFNEALKNYSGIQNPRGLDALLLTKWDAVADQVGTALTITSATGLPIALVGDGQTYTDLRRLRVSHIVDALMRA